MTYMLDTNICIYVMKKKPEAALRRFRQEMDGGLCISSVTLAELEFGVQNSSDPIRNGQALLRFLAPLSVLPFGPAAASDFAGKRYTAAADLDQYITGILEQKTILSACDAIPTRERAGEYLMLRLRTSYGIEENEYMQTYLLPFAPLEQLPTTYAQRDLAKKEENGRWRLTPKGFLVSNAILVELLEVQQKSSPLAKIR